MGMSETKPGKPGVGDISYRVVNRANAPRELCIRGAWYKWEPAGKAGDAQILSAVEVESEDFKAYAELFAVVKNAASPRAEEPAGKGE